MNTAESSIKSKDFAFMGLLALVAMALVTVAVVPALRTQVKSLFSSQQREVLAKVIGNLTPRGPRVTVLKIRSAEGLSLEIFKSEENGSLNLLTKIPLFETRDGHFFLNGNATNLGLTDVDKDGHLEIVAPTYDDQMVPRLNIFRFNSESNSFDRVSAPPGFEP